MKKRGATGDADARQPESGRALTTYIALLRGINVGGRKLVAMADLRDLAARLGLADARTLLQSGNLVFGCEPQAPAALEGLLENEVKKRLGLETCFFVRTAAEWQAIVGGNPFGDQARRDPGHLVLLLLKAAPSPAAVAALQAAISGPEVVRADGRQAYAVYPDGTGRSKLTSALIERKLGTRATARNWNTVRKLAALAGA